MCGQHNVRVFAGDNTGQNTKDTRPSPRIEIKIPDPTGNRTRAAWLEGRDSTNHATATEQKAVCVYEIPLMSKILTQKLKMI